MPTRKPPAPDTMGEMNERRIAEYALEESRLSNLAYRFELKPLYLAVLLLQIPFLALAAHAQLAAPGESGVVQGHLHLAVTDVDRSVAFYRDVLVEAMPPDQSAGASASRTALSRCSAYMGKIGRSRISWNDSENS